MSIDFQPGDVLKTKVTNIKPYGFFCEFVCDDGTVVKGLVHISKIYHGFVSRIEDFVNIGDMVEVQVVSYDEDKKHLKLDYKSIRPELNNKKNNNNKEENKTKDGFQHLKEQMKQLRKNEENKSTDNEDNEDNEDNDDETNKNS